MPPFSKRITGCVSLALLLGCAPGFVDSQVEAASGPPASPVLSVDARAATLNVGAVLANVALHRTGWASSELDTSHTRDKAHNGNISDGWSPSGSDVRPWLEIDLGQAYTLSRIELVTRQGCCHQPEERRNFEIWASNEADMSLGHVVLGGVGPEGLPSQSTWTLDIGDLPAAYRYIAAVKTADGPFFIAELRVFGVVTNVAPNMVVQGSSEWSSTYSKAKVNNDNTSGDDGWSPSGGDARPWLVLDLGQGHRLGQIQLVTRQGCCDQPEARRNFAIWASNYDDMSRGHVVLGEVGSGGLPHQSTWTLDIGDLSDAYRYIAAVKTVNEYFFISELRVFGAP